MADMPRKNNNTMTLAEALESEELQSAIQTEETNAKMSAKEAVERQIERESEKDLMHENNYICWVFNIQRGSPHWKRDQNTRPFLFRSMVKHIQPPVKAQHSHCNPTVIMMPPLISKQQPSHAPHADIPTHTTAFLPTPTLKHTPKHMQFPAPPQSTHHVSPATPISLAWEKPLACMQQFELLIQNEYPPQPLLELHSHRQCKMGDCVLSIT